MSSLKQNIRSVLADVETFLVETLKSVKLNSGAKDHKDRLLEKIRQLLEEIPGSAGSYNDSGSGSLKISGGGDSGSGGGSSSSNLQTLNDDDSLHYAGNIPNMAVSDLKNKLQTGMLDKKKKSGFKTWEPLYCVVSLNSFYMYKKQSDSKQKEAFCLSGYEFHEAPGLEKDASKKEMCFEVIKAGEPTYQFRAASKEGMEIWKEAITKGIQIAMEEEPGDLYDEAELAYEKYYINLQQANGKKGDDDEEIYDDLDNVPTSFASPPSAPAPPVPRANNSLTLPKAAAAKKEERYENLMEERKSNAAVSLGGRRSSTGGDKPRGDPAADLFKRKTSGVGEGHIFPSELKKISSAAQSAGGNKRQGPPPKIDIHKDSSASKGPTAGYYSNVQSETDVKSPPSNPNKNRNLPVPPSAAEAGSAEGRKGRRPSSPLPPPPPSHFGPPPVQTESRESPPPQSVGVNNLRKMFEK